MPKEKKLMKDVEVTESTEEVNDLKAIVMLPYRVRRADTNNVVIEKLKKRTNTDDMYWCVEGYYNNHINALVKLFYKDISKENTESIKELITKVNSTEKRLLAAIQDFKL